MEPLIASPSKFASWFNRLVPGACRQLTADDAKLLTECGVIGRCGYYARSDSQMVIGVLNLSKCGKRRARSRMLRIGIVRGVVNYCLKKKAGGEA